jgi:hypothetical protein
LRCRPIIRLKQNRKEAEEEDYESEDCSLVQEILLSEREKPESLLQFNIPANHYPGWVSFRYPRMYA